LFYFQIKNLTQNVLNQIQKVAATFNHRVEKFL